MPKITYHRGSGLPIIDATVRYWPLNGLPHPSGTFPELTVRGLVDTGASHVIVKPEIVSALGLSYVRHIDNTIVGGAVHKVPSYAAEILMGTPALGFTVRDCEVLSQGLSDEYDILIGWGALCLCDWKFDRNGGFTQSW